MKSVREPDAGDPHVRFDERRRETEPGSRLRHRHYGESRRKQLLPRPTATAPAADSTLPGGISEILEDDPKRMLAIIAERLRVAVKLQDELLEEYGKVLAGGAAK